MRRILPYACAFAAVGCSDAAAPARAVDAPRATVVVDPPPPRDPTPTPVRTIDWIDDDYAAARERSRSSGKPILVDMWAPWCHTCLSMQQTVLREGSVTRHADAFVWLAIDTDREENAEIVGRLPMSFWPTFFVLASDEPGSVLASVAGATSPVQFGAFLDAALLNAEGTPDRASQSARAAAQSMASKDWASAETHYRDAIERADGALRERVPAMLVDLAVALRKQEKWKECVVLAETQLGEVAAGRAASTTDFVYYASACADQLDPDRARTLRSTLLATLTRLVDDEHAPLSVDDRSDALANLRALHLSLEDEASAKAVATRQATLLDEAWASNPEPSRRLTFAWPRAEVHAYLGQVPELIPEYRALVAALPDEYEPAYRLAWVALEAGDADLARTMATRSAELAYGPRKARVLGLLAEACEAAGDAGEERAARERVVALWEGLPEAMQRPERLAEARERLAALAE